MNVSERVLRRARELLERQSTLCKGKFAVDSYGRSVAVVSPNVAKFSLPGAIRRACFDANFNDGSFGNWITFCEIIFSVEVVNQMPRTSGYMHGGQWREETIHPALRWNDRTDVAVVDAVAAIDRVLAVN